MCVERLGHGVRRVGGQAVARGAENVDGYVESNVRLAADGDVRGIGVSRGGIFRLGLHREWKILRRTIFPSRHHLCDHVRVAAVDAEGFFAPVRRKLFALGGDVTVFVGSLHHDQGGYGIDDRLQSRRARRVRALGVRSIRRGFADDVSVLYRRLRDVHRGSGQSEVVVRMVRLRERHAPNHERHLVDGHLEVIISVR